MTSSLKSNLILVGLLTLAAVLTGVKMDSAELQAWDEARRGINALRMLQEGDFFNYRFLDQTDSFNTKPPLFTWLLAGSFEVFGVSLFALRLPSLVALLFFVGVVYRFVAEWRGRLVATYTVLILLLCNGIVGFHVGRSGDTDMLFVCFLTAGLLAFFRFFNDRQKWGLPVSVGWLALAFLTKGVALALAMPAMLVYGILKWQILKKERISLLAGVAGAILAAVIILAICTRFGRQTNYPAGYDNLWEAMFYQDGVTRFSDENFERGYQWGFLLSTLDIRFSPWIYLLYATTLFALFRRSAGKKIREVLVKDEFLKYCLLVCASISTLLLLSQNKHQWYIAPMLFFLAYPAALVVERLVKRDRRLLVGFIAVCLLLFVTKMQRIRHDEDQVAIALEPHVNLLQSVRTLVVPERAPQDLLFYLYLVNQELELVTQPVAGVAKLAKGDCGQPIMGYCLTVLNEE